LTVRAEQQLNGDVSVVEIDELVERLGTDPASGC
jgi:hypothetical protein